MEMEEVSQEQENTFSFSSYWPSIAIVGAIFSFVSFVIGLYFGYQQINSEPAGSFISPVMISSGVICLATAFAGMIAVWHYTKEVSPFMKLGQGALVGFLTGAAIVIFSTILNELWLLIDPEYTEKLIEATIANVEAMDLPPDASNEMVDAMAQSMGDQSFFKQIFIGIPIPGLLNMATAMIGVKIFAKKKDEISF
jgi:hypothetical protein